MITNQVSFGGIPIVISEQLPKTKRVTWRTERKWSHRKRVPLQQYRFHSKDVACETVIMLNGSAVMSAATLAKIELQLGERGVGK